MNTCESLILQVRILKRPVRMSPVARSLKGSQQSQSSRNPRSLGGLWWDQCFTLRIAEEKTSRDLLLSYWKVLGPKTAMQLAVPQSSCPVSQRCDISHFCQKNLLASFWLWQVEDFRPSGGLLSKKQTKIWGEGVPPITPVLVSIGVSTMSMEHYWSIFRESPPSLPGRRTSMQLSFCYALRHAGGDSWLHP